MAIGSFSACTELVQAIHLITKLANNHLVIGFIKLGNLADGNMPH